MSPILRFANIALLLTASMVLVTCGGDSSTTPAPDPAPPAPVAPPTVPSGLQVTATGPDFIEWSWAPVGRASGYDVQFSVDEAFTDEDEIIARTAQETSYRREELDFVTNYHLRVRSVGGTGGNRMTSDWSAAVVGTTDVLALARNTRDRPDDFGGPQIHVVYAVAADGEDFELDTNGKIFEMLRSMQVYLAERIDKMFRIDTFEGIPDVSFVRLNGWNESDLMNLGLFHQGVRQTVPVVSAPRLRQALGEEIEVDPDKYYAVFYTFEWGLDYITGQADVAGQLAGAYMSSTEWARFDPYLQIVYEVTMIHEVFHLMGAVANCAPNQGRGAHVVDHDLDIMSNSSAPHWEWTYIDYGNDDYYGHGRSDCVDISTSPYFEPAF